MGDEQQTYIPKGIFVTVTVLLFSLPTTRSFHSSISHEMREATNNFSVNMLKVMSKGNREENNIFSPLVLSSMMGALQQAAEGKSLEELTSALHMDPNVTREGYYNLTRSLMEKCGDADVEFPSKVYVNKDGDVFPSFKKIIEEDFNSEVENADFQESEKVEKDINNWISNKTQNKIQDIIPHGGVNGNAVVILVLAAFFSGRWQQKFRAEQTNMTEFTSFNGQASNVSTMHTRRSLYAGNITDLDAKFVQLPFSCFKYSLLLVVPNELDGLEKLIDNLEGSHLHEIMNARDTKKVTLALPKFKFDNLIEVSTHAQKMGVNEIFTYEAHLTKLAAGQMTVSQFIQKANIQVDEEGTTASAASSLMVYQYSPSMNPKKEEELEIKADHPFLVFIMHNFEHVPLFSGWVGAPRF